MDYFVWIKNETDDALAWIMEAPDELGEKRYQMDEGISVKSWFPKDVMFQLSDERGIRLSDAIPNIMRMLIVSERLKQFFEKSADATIEYFPVKIRNRKGRLEKIPYFVANLLGSVSCLDRPRSDFWENHLRKGQVQRFKKIALDVSKIPKSAKIFRLGEKMDLVLVREDLAQAIVNADLTGMQFQYLDSFGKEFRD
jgi:hypothetical protein